MNKFLLVTNLLMSAVLSRFAISKLAGWEISVNAFVEMAQPLGINPTYFRLSTGILISAVVVGYLITAISALLNKSSFINSEISFKKGAIFFNLFGLITMVGALVAEFSLRLQPKWLLVYIALSIILLSTANIFILKNKTNTINKH